MFKYEAGVKHKLLFPSHSENILTSKEYGSEEKFTNICKLMKKIKVIEGAEWYESPYRAPSKRGRPPKLSSNEKNIG